MSFGNNHFSQISLSPSLSHYINSYGVVFTKLQTIVLWGGCLN
jgi:hypothetical protein